MSEIGWADRPNPEFEQWWTTKTEAGYQYGREALENVRFGFEGAQERIHQLEQLNSRLAEQIDRQRPVIEAARRLNLSMVLGAVTSERLALCDAVAKYDTLMAQLAKTGELDRW